MFLVPAVDFKLLNSTIQDYKHRILGLRQFGMSNELEHKDALIDNLPGVYPSSLLYFVSGVLEDEADRPIVGMQRYYSGKPPYDETQFPEINDCADYFAGSANPVLMWADCNGAAGFNCTSHDHGNFDNDTPTLESVQQIVRAGF